MLSRADHPSMLRAAGFSAEVTDVTGDYLTRVRAWLRESAAREGELRAVLGDELFETRQLDRRVQDSAIQAGVLRRFRFVATAG